MQIINLCQADHYKGGTISWRPTIPSSLTSPVEIIIEERHSWTLSRYPCNQSIVQTYGIFNDTQSTLPATLTCISSGAVCTASSYQTINSPLFCTDFSTILDVSTGTFSSRQNLALNSVIDIAWRGAAWATQTFTNSFSLVAHIDLTPLPNGKINTSPVTGSLPVVRVRVGFSTVIQILATDWDTEQVVRCRWSNQLPLDECGNICLNLPNAVLNPIDCFITWTPILRPEDIANGKNESIYVIAVTAEDFINASSNVALSSVPHQMLIHVYTPPSDACSTIPVIAGAPRRNQACLGGISVNSLFSFTITTRVTCMNNTIVEFVTSTPFGMIKNNTIQASNFTFTNIFQWRPRANQTGVQTFCVAAIDNYGVSSNQYCFAMAVGATGTTFPTTPVFVQGTWSPVGTVMITQRRFSIQANVPIKRPVRNGSIIVIRNSVGTAVWSTDCRFSPDVYYSNNTLIFFVRTNPWILGETYYVTLAEGVATADQYCGMESPSFSNAQYWRFTIWDSSKSSTTTYPTTTTTATTHTVTTRVMGTSTVNTLYTTTGIPAYTTFSTTSTTSTTSTSATTTTTTSATTSTTTTTTTTEYIPNADVIYPKDMEEQCVQPVTIATAIVTLVTLPLHCYAMINLFIKMNSNFQKDILKTRNARRNRFDNISYNNEENQSFV